MFLRRSFVCFLAVIVLFQTSCRLGSDYEVASPNAGSNQSGGSTESSLTGLKAAVGLVMQGPSTAKIDACRGPFTVEGRDGDAKVGMMSADNGAVQISGMLVGTEMYSDANCTNRLASETMTVPSAGASQMSFYVIPRSVGTANLVATQGSMNPARLTTAFTAGSPTTSVVQVARNIVAFRCVAATVALKDRLGNLAAAESDADFDLSVSGLPSLELYSNSTCTQHATGTTVVTGSTQSPTFYVFGSAPGDGTIRAASGTSLPSAQADVTVVNTDAPKLAFSVAAGTHRANTCVPISILSQTSSGATLAVRMTTPVALTDNSGSFAFYRTSSCANPAITAIDIPDGSSSVTVYGNTTEAPQTVSISATATNYASGTGSISWIGGDAKKLVFIGLNATANVGDPMPGHVELRDQWDNVTTVDARTTINISKAMTSVGNAKILAGSCTGAEQSQLFVNINGSAAPFCLKFTRPGAMHLDADSAPLIGANADFVISPSTGMPWELQFDTADTAVVGECKPFTILTWDEFGNPQPAPSAVAFRLDSVSPTARFFANGNPCANPITALTINAGSSSANGYWMETKAGTTTLTARSTTVLAHPLNASADIVLSAGAPKTLEWIGVPQWTYATFAFGPMSLVVKDVYGNLAKVTTAVPVDLSMSVVTDEQFSLAQNFSSTITRVTFPVNTNRINGIYAKTRTTGGFIDLIANAVDTTISDASDTFESRAMPATTLRLATTDTTPKAGQCLPVTVTMVDANGTPLVGDPVGVTLSTDRNESVYRSSSTCVAAMSPTNVTLTNSAPVVTVYVRSTVAGPMRLMGLVTGTTLTNSLPLTVGVGDGRRLVLEASGPASFFINAAGGAYQAARTDEFGNLVSASAAVPLVVNSAPAGLEGRAAATGSATPVIGTDGSGDFYLRSNGVGNYVFSVTAGGLTSGARPVTVRNLNATVAAISPTEGPEAGGTPVNITGSNFAPGSQVKLGGVLCTNIQIVNTGSINCTTPRGTRGFVSVTVEPPFGNVGTLPNGFKYLGPAATVSSMSPAEGPASGGTFVTIRGSGFLDRAVVDFGGSPCNGVDVTTGGASLTCQTSAHADGVVHVSVTNPNSAKGTFLNAYRYLKAGAVVSSVAPNRGPLAGGTPIKITGSGFVAGLSVKLDTLNCTSIVVAPTEINCVTPAHLPGVVDITVTNPSSVSTRLPGSYRYLGAAPVIATIAPNFGPATGGQRVTLTGALFTASAQVSIGGAPCTGLDVSAIPSVIKCTTGARVAGSVPITITQAETMPLTTVNLYTYVAAPVISALTPASGFIGQTNRLTITGSSFSSTGVTPTVTVGGLACPIASFTATQILCDRSAALAVGQRLVQVSTVGGADSVNFSVLAYPAPGISGLTPTTGLRGVSTQITVTGTNFRQGGIAPTITVGGLACGVVSHSDTQIVCNTSTALAAGAHPVVVTTPGGSAGGRTFTVIDIAFHATASLQPTVGIVQGGDRLVINGNNFLDANGNTQVSIGGINCPLVSKTATQIVCTTPPHSVGAKAVTVTRGGVSATAPLQFTYVDCLGPSGMVASGEAKGYDGHDGADHTVAYQNGYAVSRWWNLWYAPGDGLNYQCDAPSTLNACRMHGYATWTAKTCARWHSPGDNATMDWITNRFTIRRGAHGSNNNYNRSFTCQGRLNNACKVNRRWFLHF